MSLRIHFGVSNTAPAWLLNKKVYQNIMRTFIRKLRTVDTIRAANAVNKNPKRSHYLKEAAKKVPPLFTFRGKPSN